MATITPDADPDTDIDTDAAVDADVDTGTTESTSPLVDDRDPGTDDDEPDERESFAKLWENESKPWVVLERIKGTRLPAGEILSEHDYYSEAYHHALEYEQACDVDWCTHEIGGRCATCGRIRIVTDPIEEPECAACGELLFKDAYQRTLLEFVRDTLAFDMFWGVSSGSQKKAVRVLSHGFDEREPDSLGVMLNYATKNNQLLTPKGLELLLNIDTLFIDSGGYSFFDTMGEYTTSDEEYLNYVARVQPDYFALRDYPCEPDILDTRDTTVECHQQLTTERSQVLLDLMDDFAIEAEPVAAIQGWSSDEYQAHLRQLDRAGVLDQVEYIGIGTLCGREDPGQIETIVTAVRDSIGPDFNLHGFGVTREALERPAVIEALDSADTLAYSMKPMYDSISSGGMLSNTWKHEARGFLDYYATIHETLQRIRHDEAQAVAAQQTLGSYAD